MKRFLLTLWLRIRAAMIPKHKRCETCGGAGRVASFSIGGNYLGHKPCWFCDTTGRRK